MIGGVIKYFRFSYDIAVWEIGYVTLVMLLATIPDFDVEKDEKKNGKVDFGSDIQSLANYINNQR